MELQYNILLHIIKWKFQLTNYLSQKYLFVFSFIWIYIIFIILYSIWHKIALRRFAWFLPPIRHHFVSTNFVRFLSPIWHQFVSTRFARFLLPICCQVMSAKLCQKNTSLMRTQMDALLLARFDWLCCQFASNLRTNC